MWWLRISKLGTIPRSGDVRKFYVKLIAFIGLMNASDLIALMKMKIWSAGTKL